MSKHHQPGDGGVKGGEVAVDESLDDDINGTGPLDSSVLPLQGTGGASLARGPQSVKVTVPVGGPSVPFPVTVAVSVTLLPWVSFRGLGTVAVTVLLPEMTVSVSDPHALNEEALLESPL